MQRVISILYKIVRRGVYYIINLLEHIICLILFYVNNIEFSSFKTSGIPYVSVARGGRCVTGDNFSINSRIHANPIGRNTRSVIFVDSNGELIIGKNVGMSNTAIVVQSKVEIGDNVKIGGGTCIYDTDFHSLNPEARENPILDKQNRKSIPVRIKDNAFIGAHSTILKGVTIGENAVVGSGSVVTKDIPDNEIWAGNPAKFIKKIDN